MRFLWNHDSLTKSQFVRGIVYVNYLFLVITTYDSLGKFQFARRIMFMTLIFIYRKEKIKFLMVVENVLI